MVRTEDNSTILFAEVKNLSASSWNDQSQRTRALAQLDLHDKRIDDLMGDVGKKDSPAIKKLLMVTENGYAGFSGDAREEFLTAIKKKGWKLEIIPRARLESADAFLDRLR